MRVIDENINAYMDFYNNATTVSTTRSVPAERYHEFIDEGWYTRLVKMLKLESVLPIDHAPEGVTLVSWRYNPTQQLITNSLNICFHKSL